MNRRSPLTETRRRWATLAKAAEYFDCSVNTMRRYIAAGDLPGHRSPNGKTIRVDLNEVDAMVKPIPSARSVRRSA